MSGRKSPNPTLWMEGGGMVTRCDDPAVARPLLLEEWIGEHGLIELDGQEDADELFPIERAQVQRGRVEPRDPDTNDGYCWIWRPLAESAKGPGVTTAVVWSEDR